MFSALQTCAKHNMASDSLNRPTSSVNRPTSIKDIARKANVSFSTVSRALQNSPLISRRTAEKIQRIARDSGYRASAVARGLVTQKTKTIGVVVTSIADPFVSEVVDGIEECCNDHGYSVFLANSNADPDRERRVVQSFAERRVDGIVVTSSRVGALYIPLLSEMRVPIVLVNNQHPGEFVHSVMIENVQGSRDATDHLIQLGHRRIAYVGDRFGHQSDTERFLGYRQALDSAVLPFFPELVVHGDGKSEKAMAAAEALLDLTQPPTAIFCYNDMTALGVLRTLHARRLRVPKDVSVVGFDDLFIASYTDPPLTTVRQPRRRMGLLAMESLLQLMRGENPSQAITVPAELVVRESSGPVSRGRK
jgi:DNA-binding LacI/PurR family transcriptional regulator